MSVESCASPHAIHNTRVTAKALGEDESKCRVWGLQGLVSDSTVQKQSLLALAQMPGRCRTTFTL